MSRFFWQSPNSTSISNSALASGTAIQSQITPNVGEIAIINNKKKIKIRHSNLYNILKNKNFKLKINARLGIRIK